MVVWVVVFWWFLCCVVMGFVWIVVDFCGFWCVGGSGFSMGAGVGGGGFSDIKFVWNMRKWMRKCEKLIGK